MFYNSTLDHGYISPSSLHVVLCVSPIGLLAVWDSSVCTFSSICHPSLSAAAVLTTSASLSLNFSSSHRSLFHSPSSLEMQMSWNLSRSLGLLHLFNANLSFHLSPSFTTTLSLISISCGEGREERHIVEWLWSCLWFC